MSKQDLMQMAADAARLAERVRRAVGDSSERILTIDVPKGFNWNRPFLRDELLTLLNGNASVLRDAASVLRDADRVLLRQPDGSAFVWKDRYGCEAIELTAEQYDEMVSDGDAATARLPVPVPVEPRPAAGPMPSEAWVLAIHPDEHSNQRALPFAALVLSRDVDSIRVAITKGKRTHVTGDGGPEGVLVLLDHLDPEFTYRLTTAMPYQLQAEEPAFEKRVHAGADAIEDSLVQLGVLRPDKSQDPLEEGEGIPFTLARTVLNAANRLS